MCLLQSDIPLIGRTLSHIAGLDYMPREELTLNEQFGQRREEILRMDDELTEGIEEERVTTESDDSPVVGIFDRGILRNAQPNSILINHRVNYMGTSVYGTPYDDPDTAVMRTIDAVKYVTVFRITTSDVERSLSDLNLSIVDSVQTTLHALIQEETNAIPDTTRNLKALYYTIIAIDILEWVHELRDDYGDFATSTIDFVNDILRRVHDLPTSYEFEW